MDRVLRQGLHSNRTPSGVWGFFQTGASRLQFGQRQVLGKRLRQIAHSITALGPDSKAKVRRRMFQLSALSWSLLRRASGCTTWP